MKWLKFLGYSYSVPMVTSQEGVCALLPTPGKLGVPGGYPTGDHTLADEPGPWTGDFGWGRDLSRR